MSKSKAHYFAMGQKDFIGAFKQNNPYAIARRASYFERDSWQARAYFEGYQAGGHVYWDSLAIVSQQIKAGCPSHECLSLETVDRWIASGDDLAPLRATIAAHRANLDSSSIPISSTFTGEYGMNKYKAAIEKETGKKIPDSAVFAYQYAFLVECFDKEGICVFEARVNSDDLYRLGIDRHGVSLVD